MVDNADPVVVLPDAAKDVVRTTSVRSYETYDVARNGKLEQIRVVNETIRVEASTDLEALQAFLKVYTAWWRNSTLEPGLVLLQVRKDLTLTENTSDPAIKRWVGYWRGAAINLGTDVSSITRTDVLYER